MRTGGRILVDQLRLHGVDRIFCVPGESYLAALDALHDTPEIELVVCRMEAGAANMAEADGKLTGRPGVCFVTRGPGATHASIGVHVAFQDSTPMLLLVGQVPRGHRGREAFQEVDFEAMFAPLAKWAHEVRDARALPEAIARAFAVATSGRPGPVVLSLPEDVLVEQADVHDAPGPTWPYEADVGAADLALTRKLLSGAARPLVLVGGGVWSAQAAIDLAVWAEASEVPVCTSFRRQSYVDNRSRVYCGYTGIAMDPALARRIRDCDVLVALGTRLGDAATGGYELLEPPDTGKRLVHVYPDASELGRVYQPEVGIVASPTAFAAALRGLGPLDPAAWGQWTEAARADYLAHLEPGPTPGDVDLVEVMHVLRQRLPEGAIVTNGAGNFSIWAHRFWAFSEVGTQLGPTNGSMGYGLPAGIAARLRRPDRGVVVFAGDGDFLMTGQELATAVQYEAPIVVLVFNNAMYGTIRMHQERSYPGRVVGTGLRNPDFAALAHAFGAHGETVRATSEFEPALERALEAGVPALIELQVDPEAIAPQETLSGIRRAAQGD
ncbi:MAG: thiamine pyrophosphate-binding protein [Gaiellales bacterium]